MAAVQAELNSLQELGCFDLSKPLERADVLSSVANPQFARGFMLLGEKHSELEAPLRRWQGRQGW